MLALCFHKIKVHNISKNYIHRSVCIKKAILPLEAVWRRSFTDFLVAQGKKRILLSRGSVVHYFSLLLRILKFTQHFPFVAGWAWSEYSVQTSFPFWSSFARMDHCYDCRVEIIIIIFVQVVLDVVDKSTVLTDSFHFFTYLSFSDLLKC